MDTSRWPQEIVVKPNEEINPNTYKKHQNQLAATSNVDQTKTTPIVATTKAQQQQIINCPRCNSTNTKFCYYNNYSLTQPRYFCKTCRRYWTEGGSLRNIPVGGATRKNNKRPSNSSVSSSPTKKIQTSSNSLQIQQQNPNNPKLPQSQNPNPNQDLNLTFTSSQQFRSISDFSQMPIMENSTGSKSDTNTISAMELLNGMSSSRGFNSFMPMPNHDGINTIYSSGYHQNLSNLHDFKPSLNFSLDHHHQGYNGNFQESGVHHHHHEQSNGGNGRVLFPFEDLKQGSHGGTNSDHVEDINRGGGNVDASGYWTGMLGGGGW